MAWTFKIKDLSTTTAGEGQKTRDTEAEFIGAVLDALGDIKTRLVSATLPDGTLLDASELRRLYRPG